jgi:hypothetical protein
MFGAMIAAGTVSAGNYPDFTINENSVPGTAGANPALVADRLNGLFTEDFTPTFLTAFSGTFTSSANMNISAYYNNDTLVPGALGCGFAACYNMYGLMNAVGTFSVDPISGDVTFVGTGGDVGLYVDPDQIAGNGDDYLVASSASLLTGEGHFRPGQANGDFEILWTFVMLVDPTFFIAPDPFYITVDINGNFTENPLGGGTVSGSANAFFIPEPGTLLLLGIGLFGLGLAIRKRRVA